MVRIPLLCPQMGERGRIERQTLSNKSIVMASIFSLGYISHYQNTSPKALLYETAGLEVRFPTRRDTIQTTALHNFT